MKASYNKFICINLQFALQMLELLLKEMNMIWSNQSVNSAVV